MQLILSDVARHSWDYIEKIPEIFGKELLDFLYKARWQELGQLGKDGTVARQLLKFITTEQYKGRKITLDKINKWLEENNWDLVPSRPLKLLTERFLLVNNDYHKGNYAVFPSLIDFLKDQPFV
ncbi:MAG: hypothetical protein HUU38_08175 [Anaerolineales bacterium]|nr:hypothetical protein [Anaerolineales bacterium]